MKHFNVGLCLLLLSTTAAHAATRTVRVGAIDTEKKCALFALTSGRHSEGGVVTAYGAAYASQTNWTTHLVKECTDNFAGLRKSTEAALAASAKFNVTGTSRDGYVVSARVSDVGSSSDGFDTRDASVTNNVIFASVEVVVRAPNGRSVGGGLLTIKMPLGQSMQTAGLSTISTQTGQGIYAELQQRMAVAIARKAAFAIDPLLVTATDGAHVQINYGSPLVGLGDIVQVTTGEGALIRYRVVSAGDQSARAELYSDGDAHRVNVGNVASIIDASDSAANARRFERVDIP